PGAPCPVGSPGPGQCGAGRGRPSRTRGRRRPWGPGSGGAARAAPSAPRSGSWLSWREGPAMIGQGRARSTTRAVCSSGAVERLELFDHALLGPLVRAEVLEEGGDLGAGRVDVPRRDALAQHLEVVADPAVRQPDGVERIA